MNDLFIFVFFFLFLFWSLDLNETFKHLFYHEEQVKEALLLGSSPSEITFKKREGQGCLYLCHCILVNLYKLGAF